ncbi:Tudor domain containing 1, partial [Caligus rogercresseyi]
SEVFLKTRRLLPLLRAPLTVISVTNSSSNLVLRHPSGKSINTIIQDKIFLHEPDNCRNIEGQGRFNVFDYNHCLISELCSKASYPSSSSLEAIILHIQSPKEIFATPLHSLPLYADTLRQIRAFVSINSKEPTHHRPDRNKLCLVKSSADGAWYRGVALDKRLNIFLADFGMIENEVSPSDIQVMNPKLMESPLLANHCIYKGFEGLQLEIDEEDMSFLKNLAYTK